MHLAPITSDTPKNEIRRFYDIMIYAYQVTELAIWGDKYERMSFEEFEAVILKKELIGAWVDGIPVGSIHTYALNESTYAFGLFSVDFAYKGRNIGRSLIQAAEKKAADAGASFMELEILRLKHEDLPVKKQLHDWYVRLGYQRTRTVDFIERKPDKVEKAQKFIAPSVFDCYRKELVL